MARETESEKSESSRSDEITLSPEQMELVGIAVAPLSNQAATAGFAFPARVVIPPHQIRDVSAAFAVKIESVAVQIDQRVEKGTLLAHAESPTLIRAQSEFLQAIDQQKFLEETLAREKSLISDHVLSLKQLQNTQKEHSQATARAAEQRQMLRDYGMTDEAITALLADRTLTSKTVVTSPTDGIVLDILVTPGQRVEMQNPMFKVAQLAPLWLELQVPVDQVARFSPGILVTVPKLGAKGRVIAIGSTADHMTQVVTVRAVVTDNIESLKPGQFVEALADLPTDGEKTWKVRPEAVIRMGKQAFVFVKAKAGFRAQPVTILQEMPETIVISGALMGNEEIAVRGLAALKGAWQGLGGSE